MITHTNSRADLSTMTFDQIRADLAIKMAGDEKRSADRRVRGEPLDAFAMTLAEIEAELHATPYDAARYQKLHHARFVSAYDRQGDGYR